MVASETQQYQKSFSIALDNQSLVVADAFGVVDGWVNRIVNVELPSELPPVVLITGESGCGKSTLLRMIGEPTEVIIPDKPLHQWADSDEDSLRLLNAVGLNDASLFALRYEQLSDSQQARARIYSSLVAGTKTLIVDEFLATLDRRTAQALAFSLQKVLRRSGIRMVVATAQDDLEPFLQPDLTVKGLAFPSRWRVKERSLPIKNPFDINIHQVDKTAYRMHSLGEIHYKGKYTGGRQEYLSAAIHEEVVGWLVGKMLPGSGQYRIARLVVHPTYRGCGVGRSLVQAYLQLHPDADTLAAMARFNPVFEKAGMVRIDDIVTEPPPELKKDIPLSAIEWASKTKCFELMANPKYRELVAAFANSQFVNPGGQAATMTKTQMREYIIDNQAAAATLLWNLRRKVMAKYVGPQHPKNTRIVQFPTGAVLPFRNKEGEAVAA
jgi:ABC-type ATPase with predicted acetyltransferase domain